MMREDRELAQTLTGVNLVVEAGAGTGKTTLLIDRLCLCVLAQNISVEKLVALTFTEKAAAEIKTRFIFKLQELITLIQEEKSVPVELAVYQTSPRYKTLRLLREKFFVKDTDLVSRAQTALARLDRGSIGTIHSFCAEILKMFPLEAGLSPLAQIDTGQRATQLFESYWNPFLDTQLGLNAPRASQWKQVLAEIPLDDMKAFAQQLAALKPVTYDYYSHRRMLAGVCAQKAAQAQAWLNVHLQTTKKPRAIEKALGWAVQSLARTQAFLNGEQIPATPQEECPTLSARYTGWEADELEDARSLIAFAQKITPENQTLFLTALSLVSPLAQQVRRAYEAEGVLSFDDLIIKARDLLQQNLYVRRVLKEKFDVLFIDEFQDTDPVQGELLLFLAEEKSGTASRWQDVRLLPGKLIVVGDPKQSIYRFRGADITAYELFTELILKQGGKKCFLQCNYRSQPAIIATANAVCSRAMVQESAFQPAYVPIFTEKTAAGSSVEWLFVRACAAGKLLADDGRHNQAELIATWIKNHVGVDKLAKGRTLAYQDIAILTRAGTHTRIYADAFRRHGIAFQTETDKDFFHKQELNDLLLFLRAVADPEDKIALAGVLRSPLGGLTDEELYQVSKTGFSLANLIKQPHTAAIAAQIQHFAQLAGRVSVQELVQRILAETFLPEVCAAAYEGERTLGYLQQFAWLAAQYQTQPTASLATFLADMQEKLAHPEDFTLPPADETSDAVSILTVHKSKGLEFPVVILADLSHKETSSNVRPAPHLFSWQYNMYGLRVGNISDVNLAFLEEEQKKHNRCEEVRVLYVALTRAREKLLLVADGRAGAEKSAGAFAAAGLLPDGETVQQVSLAGEVCVPVTYGVFQDPRTFLYRYQTETKPTSSALQPSLWRTVYSQRLAAYQTACANSKKQAPSDLAGELLTEEQRRGAELGTVCHRALELLVSHKETDLTAACTRAAQGVASARCSEAQEILVPFINSPLYQAIISCKLLASEMPFTLALPDGSVQNGLMDAVLTCADGSIWVIDYKTDRVKPGQEAVLFEQKYRAQLTVYQQAAQRIFTGKTVRVSAIFVRTFAVVDL